MKKTLFAIILLIIFISHVHSQNFIGGRLKHMETGILTASPIDSDTVERPVLTFSTLLSRSDAFDDSDKDIFIGTCNLSIKCSYSRLFIQYYVDLS